MNKKYKLLVAVIARYNLHMLMTHTGISFATKFHQLLADRKAQHGSAQRIQRCWDDAIAWFNLNRIMPRVNGPVTTPPRAISVTEGMLANNTRSDGTVILAENGFTFHDTGRRSHFTHTPRHGTWKGETNQTPKPQFFSWLKDGVAQRSTSNHSNRLHQVSNEKFVKQRIAFGRIKTHAERLAFASALIKEFYKDAPESKRAQKTISTARELVEQRFYVSDKKSRNESNRLLAMLKS